MSVGAVKIYEDKIIIGADSQQTYGWGHKRENPEAKIWKGNDIIFASTGTSTEISFFQIYCSTTKPKGSEMDDILQFFVEFAEWKKKKTASEDSVDIENGFLFIYGKKVFRICEGFSLLEIKDFNAIGAGFKHTETALYLGHSVEESIRVACKLSPYCEEPIIIHEVIL